MTRQRGINNQPSETLDAEEASSWLGIQRKTLYAYASRGMVRSIPGEGGRARRYFRDDLARLKARHDARAGHAAVAAGALRWGEPVLDSELTRIDANGPAYRGISAIELAESDTSFEAVAELLWTGRLPAVAPAWSLILSPQVRRLHSALPRGAQPFTRLLAGLVAVRAVREPADVTNYARQLVSLLPSLVSTSLSSAPARSRAKSTPRIAMRLAQALGGRRDLEAIQHVERALILCADHELNASAFTARIAASAGAGLAECMLAALATLSGSRHGGVCERLEELIREIGEPQRARRVVGEWLARGELIPGFNHPLYPKGDPRAAFLLRGVEALTSQEPGVRTLLALLREAERREMPPPTLDLGLVALALALRQRSGSASVLFAIGRSVGFIAHALEQRASQVLLRPRARYTGGALVSVEKSTSK